MELPRLLLAIAVLPVALLVCGPAQATSCAGHRAFLDGAASVRGEVHSRVVRARVVPFDAGVPGYKPPPGSFMFEVLEFIDGKVDSEPGGRLVGTGVQFHLLNVLPQGRDEPLPPGSEWIFQAWAKAGRLSVGACGAILELRGDTVHGFIRGPNLDPAQAMPLAELRRTISGR